MEKERRPPALGFREKFFTSSTNAHYWHRVRAAKKKYNVHKKPIINRSDGGIPEAVVALVAEFASTAFEKRRGAPRIREAAVGDRGLR